jgi:hypothetical protein
MNLKNFWVIDLKSGRERLLTNFGLPPRRPNHIGGDSSIHKGRAATFTRPRHTSAASIERP